jgi:hypothetical protein
MDACWALIHTVMNLGLLKSEEVSSAVVLLACIRKPLISISCLDTEYPKVFVVFLGIYGNVRHIA